MSIGFSGLLFARLPQTGPGMSVKIVSFRGGVGFFTMATKNVEMASKGDQSNQKGEADTS